ncbi:MAG TPA: peptide chain release factor N(5)-glutamine methyltransferase [Gaiellaceae bacterium]|nr:peptide chain release factor N(5)-glutamine methyltransferase [Gaiellaceae bacterium]
MTVEEALRRASERLGAAGVETPRVDAELLLAHVLGTSRSAVYSDPRREVPASFESLLERREQREPLAYVLGEWGFRRLVLKTDERALVPRPETEIVVERCLALLAGASSPRVLDLGTGTGAIALAIADEHPAARVTAVDSSAEALALARENAAALGLQVDVRPGGIETAAEGWDLVVSNPPYVRAADWEELQPEIRNWEPRPALVGEGLHEEIARIAQTRKLVLEVGDGQAESVARTLEELGYAGVTITRDLADAERVVEGSR